MPVTPQDLAANLKELPPLPAVASHVLQLASDPDSTMEDLRRVVSTDAALAAQVLRIANSPMFGMVREVTTLNQAVMTLGFSTIKSVALASSTKSLYARGAAGLHEKLLWEHALVTALSGRAYAKAARCLHAEDAFLAGLLHDIGKTVMAINLGEKYMGLVRAVYNGELDGDVLALEAESFGFHHAMVGEALLTSWNLAPGLVEIVRWHHEPAHASKDVRDVAAYVAIGNQIALEALDRTPGLGNPESLDGSTKEALGVLGLAPEKHASYREFAIEALESDKTLVSSF